MYKSLINKQVEQELSTKETIQYFLGDEENSLLCDFMECAYSYR